MRDILEEQAPNAHGLTAKEWARVLARSYDWTCDMLKEKIAAGHMTRGKRRGSDLAGRPRDYDVYFFCGANVG